MPYDAIAGDFARGVAVFFLVPLAFLFLALGYRLLKVYRTDRTEYMRNQLRNVSLAAAIRGEASSFYDGVRDERVSAGIAVDTKRNEWVEQGKLSEEAISNVLR
jgi:hypothetical protein